jgi:hypothetical protein
MKGCGANPPEKKRGRRGSILTAELLLILPILVFMLAGMVELGAMLHGKQKLAAACREGARAASISGDPAEVNRVVQLSLGLDVAAGVSVEITAENGSQVGSPGEMVLVTVGLPVSQISFFSTNFFGLGSQMVYSQAAMRRE